MCIFCLVGQKTNVYGSQHVDVIFVRETILVNERFHQHPVTKFAFNNY
jgi:hypothetical protein